MNKKIFFISFAIIALSAFAVAFFHNKNKTVISPQLNIEPKKEVGEVISNPDQDKTGKQSPKESGKNGFLAPLRQADKRITKKPFGIFITPQNSPVQPERFSGYHTGADFEVFPDELNTEVDVRAICEGQLLQARKASGYGGVLLQSCELEGKSITVIYGHINLASMKFETGEKIITGETLGTLGEDKSVQTDGERKHLHLSIQRGSAQNILGYVQNEAELAGWIDPCSIDGVCK